MFPSNVYELKGRNCPISNKENGVNNRYLN